MSKYQLEVTLKANKELSKISGFTIGTDVTLVCEFEYKLTDKIKSEFKFEFYSVHYCGMNPNRTRVRVCSDRLYETIKQACIRELIRKETEAYDAYIKSCG